jgi:hypothetical protein
MLWKPEQINMLWKPEQINTLLELEQINTLKPKKTYTLLELEQINTLLKLKRTDTIVSLAWTCKKILEICTKVCEDRLFTLLTLDPNNTNLVLYKRHIQKWYRYKNSSTPLRWTVFSLLGCPVEKTIQWVILPPRKFIVNNITLSCLERRMLWLYKTHNQELVS